MESTSETIEQADVTSVTQWVGSRERPKAHVQPDGRSDPCKLDNIGGRDKPALDAGDLRTRYPDGATHGIERQPGSRPGVAQLRSDLRQISMCTALGTVCDERRSDHGLEHPIEVLPRPHLDFGA